MTFLWYIFRILFLFAAGVAAGYFCGVIIGQIDLNKLNMDSHTDWLHFTCTVYSGTCEKKNTNAYKLLQTVQLFTFWHVFKIPLYLPISFVISKSLTFFSFFFCFTLISNYPCVRCVTINSADTGVNTIFPLWKWASLTVCVKDYKCQLEPEITAAQINQRVNPISLSALRPICGHGMVIDEIWHYHKQSHCL